MKKCYVILVFSFLFSQNCEEGYTAINEHCFFDNDIAIIQEMIDNSYNSHIDLDCFDGDPYCGSPNPYMDSLDAWFWVSIDGVSYNWTGNGNGLVEPLELGIQEWEDGRLKSIMCGAYIYCQLSGPIPENINELSEIEVLRLEYNYLEGFVPETICEVGANHTDYLSFDISGNYLCPPYPECIDTSGFFYQETSSCNEIGDINHDTIINVQDVVLLVSYIIHVDSYNYQELVISDLNADNVLNVADIVILIGIILEN